VKQKVRFWRKLFLKKKIKTTIFFSYSNGAPGPDGLPFMFYQKYWEMIKDDLVLMFDAFHQGDLVIHRINFADITLIPKENRACTMRKFRPISLLNCSYKIFTKVLTNRINKVADRLICSNQTVFIRGRYILESSLELPPWQLNSGISFLSVIKLVFL
jgi:hypothetical protein